MIYQNREDAARLLLKKLKEYQGKNPLVLGIPRGAMPMAQILATGLRGELSAIFVHKIPAPEHEEFAVGSVGLSGKINKTESADQIFVSDSYIHAEAQKQLQLLRERYLKYGLKQPNYEDRIVIIIDDGIATGATVIAAIHEVLVHHPKKIIVAAAVSAPDSADQIREMVDELVLLDEPENFHTVGQFFEHFPQVSDDEVMKMLHLNPQINTFPAQQSIF